MKFSAWTAAFASFSLFASTIAAPANQASGAKTAGQLHNQPKKRKFSAEEQERRKYFHEPGHTIALTHYDRRYFKEIVSDEERRDTQYHMIRAYLNFFNENNLDTWIAHGTLLGWWWNGKRLPWDWDMDTQVSGATLAHLGEKYNQTMYKYVSKDGNTNREFLVDVNPWIWERERGDGMNIIDARFIDTRNGLFIDITGLSETKPDVKPGIWSCKNYHRYHTSDLYPMRETMFEGVPAKVPYAYDKILIDEYKEKALVVTEFEGHRWDPEKKDWFKTPEQLEKERKEAEKQKQKQKQNKQKKAVDQAKKDNKKSQ